MMRCGLHCKVAFCLLTGAAVALSQPPRGAQPVDLVGAAGCAAASCHGSPQPGVTQTDLVRGGEYPLWQERDPHARSWRSMCSDQATQIMQRLGIIANGKIQELAGFNNCLACHSTGRAESDVLSGNILISEGVGCEACHGAAGDWLAKHTQSGWQPEQSATFIRNERLLDRAERCAGCHIGDARRDMNHDLIAAGHPALRFDLATYHNRLPKHWREAQRTASPAFESRLWLAGAIAQADASLDLLKGRAMGMLDQSQWPELSSYDCASCHHSFDLVGERDPVGDFQRPSSPRSATIHLAGFKALLKILAKDSQSPELSRQLLSSLNKLENHLESSFSPDRLQTIANTRRAQADLQRWRASIVADRLLDRFSPKDLQLVVREMESAPERNWTWEYAAAAYLAAVASRPAWQTTVNQPSQEIHAILKRLRNGLAFPAGQDTPLFLVENPPPRTLSRREVQSLFRELTSAAD